MLATTYNLVLVLCYLVTAVAAKRCANLTIPVNVLARNGVFRLSVPHSNSDVTQFALDITSTSSNFTNSSLVGYATVKGEAFISAKFCAPESMPKHPIVQLLTHGIGFDKTYWDLPYDNFKNSYVDVAVDAYGFCTLAIDRFGVGNSTVANPLNIVQTPVTLSTIYEITKMLRTGKIPFIPHPFKKVVHVGHSFGSILTYGLVAAYPEVSDGIILTSFGTNGRWIGTAIAAMDLQLANLNQPARFGNATSGPTSQPNMKNLPDGYVTSSDIGANEFSFFSPGNFEPSALEYSEAHKMPATVGEYLTLGGAPASAPDFKGPVLVITGNEDEIYCGGNCLAGATPQLPSVPAGAQQAFPNASAFEAYVQPDTGHAMNFHHNTSGLYHVMLDFLGNHGLTARGY